MVSILSLFFCLLHSPFQGFRDYSMCSKYNQYYCHSYILRLFFSSLPSICLSFCFLLFSICAPSWRQKSLNGKSPPVYLSIYLSISRFLPRSLTLFFIFLKLTLCLVFWLGLCTLFVSQNPRYFNESHSLGQILVCAYITWYVKKIKLVTLVEGDPKVPFSKATTPSCRGGRYSIL